jgi:patatin-related protein
MYGGVSLAIYMNGISQELLRVVRASSDLPDDQLDVEGTERIYRQAARALHAGRRPGTPLEPASGTPRTRVVVDILSGTSAGGINAVFLAKALTLNCRNLSALAEMWKSEGDFSKLLNDGGSEPGTYRSANPPTSLLNSQRMYGKLLEAMEAMDRTPKSGPHPLADEIDLFVTATDLHGLYQPLELADSAPEERMHRMVFHFRSESQAVAQLREAAAENKFTAAYNPMLAFAARCTSSFPGAFEPMCLNDIKKVRAAIDINAPLVQSFFHRYSSIGETRERIASRLFADGGYLDNRPFSYPIETISNRDATLPVQRKLLILDPFPEYSDQPMSPDATLPPVSFTANLMAAATSLPRYEAIRGDIELLQSRNRTIAHTRELINRVGVTGGCAGKAPPVDFEAMYLDAMVAHYGEAYRPYHHLRVMDTTTQVARVLAQLAGFQPKSDECVAIEQIVRVWRSRKYRWDPADPSGKSYRSENEFLMGFDAEYRLRRINHLRIEIDRMLGESMDRWDSVCDVQLVLRKHCARISRLEERLRTDKQLMDGLEAMKERIGAQLHSILRGLGAEAQQREAERLLDQIEEAKVDNLVEGIRLVLLAMFSEFKSDLLTELDRESNAYKLALKIIYLEFPCRDAIVYPVLRGTGADEAAEVEIYRVGPAEATLYPAEIDRGSGRREEKLAGLGLGAFAAFLSYAWRENDILWGRLDGAERILCAMMPHAADSDARDKLIGEARRAILDAELGPAQTDSLLKALAGWMRETMGRDYRDLDKVKARLQELLKKPGDPVAEILAARLEGNGLERFMRVYYKRPPAPDSRQQLEYLGRALRILSEMIAALPAGKGSLAFLVRLLTFLSGAVLNTVALTSGVRGTWMASVLGAAGLGAGLVWIAERVLSVHFPGWVWALALIVAAGLVEKLAAKWARL